MSTLVDIAIDLATGDVYLDGDDLAIVEDNAAIKQGVTISVRFVLGEWFLDKSEGVDYFGTFFKKQPNITAMREMIRSAILASPGITEVVSVSFKYEPQSRTLTVTYVAKADGKTIKDTFSFEAVTG